MKFSKRSFDRLSTCHPDLQKVMLTAIQVTRVDFSIVEGHRTLAKQIEYFKAGKSRIDGVNKRGKHMEYPSLAVDICAYVQGKADWSDVHLGYLGGLILGVADDLYSKGEISRRLTWGADWDNDGVLVYDHTLKDLPHYQL